MITIHEIRVGDSPNSWRAAGFTVDGDICVVDGVRIRLGGPSTGITDWTLRGIPGSVSAIDGVPTAASEADPVGTATHANGVTRIDHVVLTYRNVPGGGRAKVELWGRRTGKKK